MSKSSKKSGVSLSPAQRQRLNTQLEQTVSMIQGGEVSAAESAITQLVRKYPTIAEVQHVACGFYTHIGDSARATYAAQRAVELQPGVSGYHRTLGILLVQQGKVHEGIRALETAIEIEPRVSQAKGALALAYANLGELNKARALYLEATQEHPDDHEPPMNHALLESDLGNASQSVSMMKDLIGRFPTNPVLRDSLCMFSSYDDHSTREEIFQYHKDFGHVIESSVKARRSYPNVVDPNKKIRVGFVSSDLREHSIAYFLEPLLTHMNRDHFEIALYFTSRKQDEVSERFKSYALISRDCFGGVVDTLKTVQSDQVDVLFELNGHFASNMLPLFAAKPAPVSITAIGYANTTGLTTVDARFVDQITDPVGEVDGLATENLVRVDDCFLCYQPSVHAPDFKTLDATIADRPFTFGSFNDLRKMSGSTLETWAAILKQAPESKLMLKSGMFDFEQAREEFLNKFHALGIDRDRIDLRARTQTTRDHLELYHQLDCALDTFPYAGTTTTCESLYMGVPVVTMMTNAHAGRVGGSLLTAIGQTQDIAHDAESYVDLALSYYKQGKREYEARSSLRNQMMGSVLTDQEKYASNVERLIQNLWTQWCESNNKHSQSKGAS